jgi:hypothetical protein
MQRVAAIVAVAGALIAPAAADAARYFNGDSSHGGSVLTSGRTIQHLEIYCTGEGNTDTSSGNDFDFSLSDVVYVGRGGRFSYSGEAYGYGNEHQPRGQFKVRVSGHLNGSKSISMRWTLPGCGSGASVASVQR